MEVDGVKRDVFYPVRKKLASLENYLLALRSAQTQEGGRDEQGLEIFIEYRTIQAIDDATKIAWLIVGDRRIERQQAIDLLVRLSVVDQATHTQFKSLIGLRNKLVHDRSSVEFSEVSQALPQLLKTGEQFIGGVTVFLKDMTVELLEARLKEIT